MQRTREGVRTWHASLFSTILGVTHSVTPRLGRYHDLDHHSNLVSSYSFPEEPSHSCWRVGDAAIGNASWGPGMQAASASPVRHILQFTALGSPARTDSAVTSVRQQIPDKHTSEVFRAVIFHLTDLPTVDF